MAAKMKNLWIVLCVFILIILFIGLTTNRFQGLLGPTGESVATNPGSFFQVITTICLVSTILILSTYFYLKNKIQS